LVATKLSPLQTTLEEKQTKLCLIPLAELFCRHLSLQTKLASLKTLLEEEQTKFCLIALAELFCGQLSMQTLVVAD
jgi:hypothetical protein